MAGNWRYVALASSPAGTGTGAGLTAYRLTHNPGLSLEFAMLAGALTLASVIILELAQIAEAWIRHRPERHFSSAVKRVIRVATGRVGAERRKAALLASGLFGVNGLTQGTHVAMRITRDEREGDPAAAEAPGTAARADQGSADTAAPTGMPDPMQLEAAQRFAEDLAARRVPSVRAICAQLHVGRPRAQRLHAYLTMLSSGS